MEHLIVIIVWSGIFAAVCAESRKLEYFLFGLLSGLVDFLCRQRFLVVVDCC